MNYYDIQIYIYFKINTYIINYGWRRTDRTEFFGTRGRCIRSASIIIIVIVIIMVSIAVGTVANTARTAAVMKIIFG